MSGRGGWRGRVGWRVRGGGVGGRGQPSSSVPASGGRGFPGGGPQPHYPPSVRSGGVGGRSQPSSSIPASGGRGFPGGRPQPHYHPSSSTPSVVPQYPSLPTPSSSVQPSQASQLPIVTAPSSSKSIQPPAAASSVQPPQASQLPIVTAPSSSKPIQPPSRPGFGRVGDKCVVRANHFLVDVIDKDLHHYNVTITPEVTSKKVCRDIISELVTAYYETHLGKRWPAYDGRKSLYTAGSLPFSSQDFVVKLVDKDGKDRRERKFIVAIKVADKADLHHLQQFLGGMQPDVPQETLQVLDVVLRSAPSTNYVVVGRSFFSPSLGDSGTLGDGLEYWKGFYQGLRPTQMGLSLNVDMSAGAFYEKILVSDFVKDFCNVGDLRRPLSDQDRLRVKKALKNIRVQICYRDRRQYKISGVSAQPLSQLMFSRDELGTKTSVVQYFRERYEINLSFPSLPALQAGSDIKPVYLPMELCEIVKGQRYSKKLNEKQVTALLRATCQRPRDREQSISNMVRYNNYNNDNLVNEFGLRVNAQLALISGRVLPAPKLQYGRWLEEAPHLGCWNMHDRKVYEAGQVEFWACVSFSPRMTQKELTRFCDGLTFVCRDRGLEFNSFPLIPIHQAHPTRIKQALADIYALSNAKLHKMGHTGRGLDLVIIILPEVSGYYGMIKRVCETELGIISQCCQPSHAMKRNTQYLENLSLKINVKVRGKNTVLVDVRYRKIELVTDRPTIIFGAYVTHPQPGEDSSPSIAAVVASMDWPEICNYRGLFSAQTHGEEIICDLYKFTEDKKGGGHGGMIRDQLLAFRRAVGFKPDRIIFYRDGVSEGQFSQVLLREVDAIRKACLSLEENYLPRITFVVVQKRHHTRFFPARHGDQFSTDRSGNILPGTVVDTNICHPTEFDFYLCSHAGIQGTSRPTHYHVLYDENNFPADALQILTNNLCYTYARCTHSVSIVSPAYYARLVAFRARSYIEDQVLQGGSSSGERATAEEIAEVRPLPEVNEKVKGVMFYV